MFHETGVYNPKKDYRVLSCIIYTIIKNYVCIDYLSCKYVFCEIPVGSRGGSKHREKVLTEYWVFEFHIC